MILNELGREYLRQSEIISCEAKKLRIKMKNAKGKELYRLRRNYNASMAISRELRITGKHLIHYYEE